MPRSLACALAVALVATVASAQDIDAEIARARAVAIDGRRAEAITALRALLAKSPAHGDLLLVLGTVLSWDGSYDEARTHLERVLIDNPNYTDALAALLNVELWSGRPQSALAIARRGLELAPNDDRFLQGRRRAQEAVELQRPWKVSAGYNGDRFSDGRGAWHETQASLTRDTPVGPVSVRGSRAERFAITDSQFEVEMYPRFRSGTYAYLSWGVAPDERLYPGSRVAADLYHGLGAGFEGSVGVRRLSFADTVTLYVGSLGKYVGNWLVSGRVFVVPDDADATRSYHGSVRRYVGEDATGFVGARYSHGSSREDVRDLRDVEALGSDTVAFELQVPAGRRLLLDVSGGVSRLDAAGATLWQQSFSASAGVRF